MKVGGKLYSSSSSSNSLWVKPLYGSYSVLQGDLYSPPSSLSPAWAGAPGGRGTSGLSHSFCLSMGRGSSTHLISGHEPGTSLPHGTSQPELAAQSLGCFLGEAPPPAVGLLLQLLTLRLSYNTYLNLQLWATYLQPLVMEVPVLPRDWGSLCLHAMATFGQAYWFSVLRHLVCLL